MEGLVVEGRDGQEEVEVEGLVEDGGRDPAGHQRSEEKVLTVAPAGHQRAWGKDPGAGEAMCTMEWKGLTGQEGAKAEADEQSQVFPPSTSHGDGRERMEGVQGATA